jgi:isobutyryl-CoA dehydrogenase
LLGLNEEQAEYFRLAKQFADTEMAPFAGEWDEKKHFPEDVLRKAAGLGFGAINARVESGGTGLGRLDASVIYEALATADVSTTAYITIHNMCGWMIDTFGSEALRTEFVPVLASMDKFASYCLTEPNAGSDAASLQTSAVRKGDDYVLNGSKMFISGGGRADVYVVMARTGGAGPKGISCFAIDKDSKGLSFGKNEVKLGWNTQPTAAVMFDDVRVPATRMVGEEGDGFKIAMMGLDGGRLSIGTCSVGGAYRCLSEARSYVRTRKQFSEPLASLQSVQFKLADMATRLVISRTMIRQAAAMLDAKHHNARAFAAMAKQTATDNGFSIINDALQLHGGYGYLREYPIERFLRDTRVHQILEGTNEIMRVIVSRQLLSHE